MTSSDARPHKPKLPALLRRRPFRRRPYGRRPKRGRPLQRELSMADLSAADLRGAKLNGAYLSRANLNDADLSGSDLSSADLSYANMRGASLNETRWDGETNWAGADGLYEARNVPEALAQAPRFKAAMVLSKGVDEGRRGNVLEAVQAYQDAQEISISLSIGSEDWDLLCWAGALHNQADKVLNASEKATDLNPDCPIYRDTRGLVRALSGDLHGATEDFEFVVNALNGNRRYRGRHRELGRGVHTQRRREWLEALRLWQSPFTSEVLELLKDEVTKWVFNAR
jgi:hypothetical protein